MAKPATTAPETPRSADESAIDYRELRAPGTDMEFTLLFVAVVIVMLVVWRGLRLLAMALFAVVLIAAVATFLHHATDALKLSF